MKEALDKENHHRQRRRSGEKSGRKEKSSRHKVHHRHAPRSDLSRKAQGDQAKMAVEPVGSFWNRLSFTFVASIFESALLRPVFNAIRCGFRPLEIPDTQEPDIEGWRHLRCLEVEILRTDELAEDPLIFHPLVRVSLVDGATGKLVLKSDVDAEDRHTASILKVTVNEQGKDQTTRKNVQSRYVPPVLTGPCKIQEGPVHLVAPSWTSDNVVTLRVSPGELLRTQYLLFFEILDFGGNIPAEKLKDLGGFYPIAWGFLRLKGSTSKPNFELRPAEDRGAPLRLQLYKYKPLGLVSKIYYAQRCLGGEDGTVPEVFKMYLARNREEYASTIYVRVCAR